MPYSETMAMPNEVDQQIWMLYEIVTTYKRNSS